MLLAFQFGPWANEFPDRFIPIVIGALLLIFVLWKFNIPSFSLPYYRTYLNERSARIAEAQSQVNRALEETRNVRNDYANRLSQIEAEARRHIDDAVREAEEARTGIIEDAQQMAKALRRRTEEELARERTRQRIQLRQQIVQTTLDAAEKAIVANSGDAVQHSLISEFITQSAKGGATPVVVASAPAAPLSAPAPVASAVPTETETKAEEI